MAGTEADAKLAAFVKWTTGLKNLLNTDRGKQVSTHNKLKMLAKARSLHETAETGKSLDSDLTEHVRWSPSVFKKAVQQLEQDQQHDDMLSEVKSDDDDDESNRRKRKRGDVGESIRRRNNKKRRRNSNQVGDSDSSSMVRYLCIILLLHPWPEGVLF